MTESNEERFTDEDMEDVVEPVRAIARTFGLALAASFHFPTRVGTLHERLRELEDYWEDFADELCWFVKKKEEEEKT